MKANVERASTGNWDSCESRCQEQKWIFAVSSQRNPQGEPLSRKRKKPAGDRRWELELMKITSDAAGEDVFFCVCVVACCRYSCACFHLRSSQLTPPNPRGQRQIPLSGLEATHCPPFRQAVFVQTSDPHSSAKEEEKHFHAIIRPYVRVEQQLL